MRVFDLQHGCKSRDIGHHDGAIKSVVWDKSDPSDNIVITSGDDKKVIWWDIRQSEPIVKFTTDDMITSMEQSIDRGVITVTGGKTLLIFDSARSFPAQNLLILSHSLSKTLKFDYDVSSVSIHPGYERLVAGASGDPWVRIHDYVSGNQLGISFKEVD